MIARTAAAVRRARAPPAPGWSASCARATGSSACGSRDLESGHEFEVRAQQVDQRHRGVDRRDPGDGRRPRPVPGAGVQGRAPGGAAEPDQRRAPGLITRTEKSLLFIIPWGSHWIIGTTDTDWKLDLRPPGRQPAPTSTTCSTRPTRCWPDPLTREDVVGVYAGLRPLLSGESDSTSQLSREHAVVQPGAGADRDRRRQVHDVPGDGQGRRRRRRRTACDAHGARRRAPSDVPLVGADGYHGAVERPAADWPAGPGCASAQVEHLLRPLRHADRRAAAT